MIRQLVLAIVLPVIALVFAAPADAGWIFKRSTYSHDPVTGARIDQYAAKKPAFAPADPTYLQSGYRHIRSSIRGAHGSADRLHLVQTWGAGDAIRPYGEWQRPYRAGATPYGPWGNPQGPWTLPFESWYNPYGLGQIPWSARPPYGPYGYSPGYSSGRNPKHLKGHGSAGYPPGHAVPHTSGHASATPPHHGSASRYPHPSTQPPHGSSSPPAHGSAEH